MARLNFKTQKLHSSNYSAKKPIKYIVGVDEVGRGPLAGPVAIGAVLFEAGKVPKDFLLAKDSKQLSEQNRELWFRKIMKAKRAGVLDFCTAFVGAEKVDTLGITNALSLAIQRALARLEINPANTLILLDGSLRAPDHFLFQQTIIGGDRKEPIISLASIGAKVLRDKKMCRLAKIYPQFGFEQHKGYGTSFHIETIKKIGLCDIHRRSFVSGLISTRPR